VRNFYSSKIESDLKFVEEYRRPDLSPTHSPPGPEFSKPLAGTVYAAKKATQVAGQRNNTDCQKSMARR